ncbi:hypothetical protein TTRE_0000311801 [Trichuris trichiura]|uniref:Uncharacterized protein n=1 Tax=Trichuris trichiura TaxID=36087 RepID=A0A077Z5A9_TRITR|nr:hypothetical protein TTRE_0000311801 [Trichuris trichiura]
MDFIVPNGYWTAFIQFARNVGIEHPRLETEIGATKLSDKDTVALRKSLDTYGDNIGTINRMKRAVEELLAVAMQNLSNEQVKSAVKYLNQLTDLCDFRGVQTDFCKMGAAPLLVPFVLHFVKEIRSLALSLVCALVQNRRACQNAFALAHFVPILMHTASDESCNMSQRKGLHALFCLCFGNRHVSQLFCQSGGIVKLLHFTRYAELATESCFMLSKTLDVVPQYKRTACDQRAIEELINLAYETNDVILQEKAVEALFNIVSDCDEAKKDLAGACTQIIQCIYAGEVDEVKRETAAGNLANKSN